MKFEKYMAIYRNDNLIINDESVIGTIKDLMEYFRYEIANQSMGGTDCDYENYIDNVRNMIDVISNFEEDLQNDIFKENDTFKVSVHPMGGLMIEEVK